VSGCRIDAPHSLSRFHTMLTLAAKRANLIAFEELPHCTMGGELRWQPFDGLSSS
jgi:hypothetical protein